MGPRPLLPPHETLPWHPLSPTTRQAGYRYLIEIYSELSLGNAFDITLEGRVERPSKARGPSLTYMECGSPS